MAGRFASWRTSVEETNSPISEDSCDFPEGDHEPLQFEGRVQDNKSRDAFDVATDGAGPKTLSTQGRHLRLRLRGGGAQSKENSTHNDEESSGDETAIFSEKDIVPKSHSSNRETSDTRPQKRPMMIDSKNEHKSDESRFETRQKSGSNVTNESDRASVKRLEKEKVQLGLSSVLTVNKSRTGDLHRPRLRQVRDHSSGESHQRGDENDSPLHGEARIPRRGTLDDSDARVAFQKRPRKSSPQPLKKVESPWQVVGKTNEKNVRSNEAQTKVSQKSNTLSHLESTAFNGMQRELPRTRSSKKSDPGEHNRSTRALQEKAQSDQSKVNSIEAQSSEQRFNYVFEGGDFEVERRATRITTALHECQASLTPKETVFKTEPNSAETMKSGRSLPCPRRLWSQGSPFPTGISEDRLDYHVPELKETDSSLFEPVTSIASKKELRKDNVRRIDKSELTKHSPDNNKDRKSLEKPLISSIDQKPAGESIEAFPTLSPSTLETYDRTYGASTGWSTWSQGSSRPKLSYAETVSTKSVQSKPVLTSVSDASTTMSSPPLSRKSSRVNTNSTQSTNPSSATSDAATVFSEDDGTNGHFKAVSKIGEVLPQPPLTTSVSPRVTQEDSAQTVTQSSRMPIPESWRESQIDVQDRTWRRQYGSPSAGLMKQVEKAQENTQPSQGNIQRFLKMVKTHEKVRCQYERKKAEVSMGPALRTERRAGSRKARELDRPEEDQAEDSSSAFVTNRANSVRGERSIKKAEKQDTDEAHWQVVQGRRSWKENNSKSAALTPTKASVRDNRKQQIDSLSMIPNTFAGLTNLYPPQANEATDNSARIGYITAPGSPVPSTEVEKSSTSSSDEYHSAKEGPAENPPSLQTGLQEEPASPSSASTGSATPKVSAFLREIRPYGTGQSASEGPSENGSSIQDPAQAGSDVCQSPHLPNSMRTPTRIPKPAASSLIRSRLRRSIPFPVPGQERRYTRGDSKWNDGSDSHGVPHKKMLAGLFESTHGSHRDTEISSTSQTSTATQKSLVEDLARFETTTTRETPNSKEDSPEPKALRPRDENKSSSDQSVPDTPREAQDNLHDRDNLPKVYCSDIRLGEPQAMENGRKSVSKSGCMNQGGSKREMPQWNGKQRIVSSASEGTFPRENKLIRLGETNASSTELNELSKKKKTFHGNRSKAGTNYRWPKGSNRTSNQWSPAKKQGRQFQTWNNSSPPPHHYSQAGSFSAYPASLSQAMSNMRAWDYATAMSGAVTRPPLPTWNTGPVDHQQPGLPRNDTGTCHIFNTTGQNQWQIPFADRSYYDSHSQRDVQPYLDQIGCDDLQNGPHNGTQPDCSRSPALSNSSHVEPIIISNSMVVHRRSSPGCLPEYVLPSGHSVPRSMVPTRPGSPTKGNIVQSTPLQDIFANSPPRPGPGRAKTMTDAVEGLYAPEKSSYDMHTRTLSAVECPRLSEQRPDVESQGNLEIPGKSIETSIEKTLRVRSHLSLAASAVSRLHKTRTLA
ncbi:MAG: hypothetical protein M1837_001984 [Sclerophora amabilis]|nr:MAG: hypothetical protein M1837_001984 [Sclerophora amabilis]